MNMMNNYGQQNPFENPMKGTTTVALRFKDGVVVATDRRASAGTFVASKRAKKLHQLNDYTVATIAGLVADAQYLVNLTKANLNLYELNRGYPPTTKMAGNLLASILYEQFRSYMPFYVAMLVCGLDKYGPHVYNLDASGAIIDEDYASTGSGSLFSYGVLEAFWKEGLTEDEAIKLGLRALSTSISRDTATGNGMDALVVNKDGIRWLTEEEIKKILEEL
ncbi:MAG: proteasome subunit beta [Candidatus Heimdallarchaeum aukensis]|uniref:Proteasome subunit beta n=1 Tax=Candidatus Heimdallarchaeum aukensis TaxID=2876573 RepID=A0A9Y1BNF7_9ARCH|nr:MAG: proteasome subunit beta [Candidatus Heimdallarchaeum aukensis]